MREFLSLLVLAALAAPFGVAGASSSGEGASCPPVDAVHSDLGRGLGQGDPEGRRQLAPFAFTASASAEGRTGGADGPRREVTLPPRSGRLPSPVRPPRLPRPGRLLRQSAAGPALRGFLAHPSTAPPRIA